MKNRWTKLRDAADELVTALDQMSQEDDKTTSEDIFPAEKVHNLRDLTKVLVDLGNYAEKREED